MIALRLLATGFALAAATACAPVASVSKRMDNGAQANVGRIEVYSFVPMHPLGMERLHRGAARFGASLGERLREEHIDAVMTDVEAVARKHGLSVDVTVRQDGDGLRTTGTLPERGVLAANRATEQGRAATHRLVLLPARVTVARPWNVTTGVIHWRLEHTTDGRPIAQGVMRFTADARGFPAQRMARQLVADLKRLRIR